VKTLKGAGDLRGGEGEGGREREGVRGGEREGERGGEREGEGERRREREGGRERERERERLLTDTKTDINRRRRVVVETMVPGPVLLCVSTREKKPFCSILCVWNKVPHCQHLSVLNGLVDAALHFRSAIIPLV